MKLAPSILAADLADLAAALAACEAGGADLVHVDGMDGHFVPNLSFGIPGLAALHRRPPLPLHVPLLVANPDRLLSHHLRAGAARVAPGGAGDGGRGGPAGRDRDGRWHRSR